MAPNNHQPNRYPYETQTIFTFEPDEDPDGTNWVPSQKFVAGFLVTTALFAYRVATGEPITEASLLEVLTPLSILAAFYLVPDSK